MEDAPTPKTKPNGTARIVVAALLLAGLIALSVVFDVRGALVSALDLIAGLKGWGPAIFVLLYIVATVAMAPCSVITLGAGAVFGVFWGTVWVSIGSTLGATAAFLLGRGFARKWVEEKVAGNEKFGAVERAIGREGRKIVFLIRLSPAFPYNLLNYALSLTPVKLKDYMLASWAGMIPGTIMYVYLGSIAGDLASLGAGGRTRTTGEWALYGVGLAATVAVTVYVTRLAKKALSEKL